MIEIDPFDHDAARYDAWYDSAPGRQIFVDEVAALSPLWPSTPPRLEVGVGSGRFAAALGVEYGVDPAPGALALAAPRGVRAVVGRAEELPFRAESFAAVLCVVTLCFVSDPERALREARRVLAPGGRIVVGTVPRDSELGTRYEVLAREGHPFYSRARFLSVADHISLLEGAGFRVVEARSALVATRGPHDSPVREGIVPGASFVALAGDVGRLGGSRSGE
ncbi:MAG: class I SAM-dependent methyltransferase [Acidobacteriota bacterium]|nr:class I SAM-dependent methyltransferase [Acidobacteriota bacterium]